ncbi:MAG: hypothetical protein KDI90_07560 [Alphaproteobacteria bacterium]|nr:hypothetical protein [Alphaproteobacteria bacterium]MCB9975314.1 hypothetical protein [Rhodospirillales bacterium]
MLRSSCFSRLSLFAVFYSVTALGAGGLAHATKQVRDPYVTEGELEVEWKGSATHDEDEDEQDGAWKQKAAVAYGVTDRVQLEIEGEFEKEGDSGDAEFTALALESKIQLTEQGEYWADAGVFLEYEKAMRGGPDKIEGKLLLAKDTGKFSHLANIILEREVGEDSGDETELGLAWSTRYRYKPVFEPGIEIHSGFGGIGEGKDFDSQDHRIGPVAYGKIGFFKYDVGYLVGVSDHAPDGTFKAILEYEWYF